MTRPAARDEHYYQRCLEDLHLEVQEQIGVETACSGLLRELDERLTLMLRDGPQLAPTNPRGADHTPEQVMEAVAAYYGVTVAALLKRDSRRVMTIPRFISMYLSRELTHCTLKEISEAHCRNHTGALYAINRVTRHRRRYERDIERLTALLTNAPAVSQSNGGSHAASV